MASHIVSALRAHIDFSKVGRPLKDVVNEDWYLGFTCFGGPAVHFQIVRSYNFSYEPATDLISSTRNLLNSCNG